MPEALELIEYWGFDYKTIAFVWHKTNKKNKGYYTTSSVEVCCVFKNKGGKIPTNKAITETQFYSSPVKEHSAKPIEIKKRITKMYPTHNKIELFARATAYNKDLFDDVDMFENWDVWGNEVQ